MQNQLNEFKKYQIEGKDVKGGAGFSLGLSGSSTGLTFLGTFNGSKFSFTLPYANNLLGNVFKLIFGSLNNKGIMFNLGGTGPLISFI